MTASRYTIEDLAAFSTADLVTMYNDLTGKSIKKFSSRMAGLRQIMNAQAEFVTEEAAEAPEAAEQPDDAEATFTAPDFRHTCPGCGAHQDITPAGLEGTAAESRNFCHSCSTEWFPETGKLYKAPAASPGRSAAIAKSWTNPEVAAARANRATVTVTGPLTSFFLPDGGAPYSSVAAAFRALHLPMGAHIKFRGQLKAAGTLEFQGFTFVNNAA